MPVQGRGSGAASPRSHAAGRGSDGSRASGRQRPPSRRVRHAVADGAREWHSTCPSSSSWRSVHGQDSSRGRSCAGRQAVGTAPLLRAHGSLREGHLHSAGRDAGVPDVLSRSPIRRPSEERRPCEPTSLGTVRCARRGVGHTMHGRTGTLSAAGLRKCRSPSRPTQLLQPWGQPWGR